MDDLDGRYARARQAHVVRSEPAQFDPEALVVGDDEAEVLDLRNIDPGVKDFGDDALGNGEPQPR